MTEGKWYSLNGIVFTPISSIPPFYNYYLIRNYVLALMCFFANDDTFPAFFRSGFFFSFPPHF